ncbi:MAG: hypothetical protein CMN76_03390 [Spirochaetaceae bacterium]|nr:hypothetical protein [Spirochaetaceae bacterium]
MFMRGLKMKSRIIMATAIALTGTMLYCAPQSNDNTEALNALVLTAHSASSDQIKGQGTYNGVSISYDATTSGEDFETTVTIDGQKFTASLGGDGSITLDGGNAVLTQSQKDALDALAQEFASHLEATGNTSGSRIQVAFLSVISYWAEAPEGYTYGSRSIDGPSPAGYNAASRNEGVTCIRKGTYVTAAYDDSRGSHYDSVLVGSKPRSGYGCMGRCGGDCGSWWLASSWTKDCMDHDQCSNVNYSSGGSSDPNCGDEFDEAADDWLQGVWRGCRG